MKEQRLKNLLEEQKEIFINDINIELEKSHDRWFGNFGFPLFGETSKDYHEQVYFQSYLESYTRKLINTVLKEIVNNDVSDEITWPEFEYPGIYNGYTNIECENEFGYEFINRDRRIGYRYTSFDAEEIDALLAKGNVDTIKYVIWENEDELIHFDYADDRVAVILSVDMFKELFDELDDDEIKSMYDMFVESVTNAVAEANSMISLVTLPGFTSSYLHKNRQKMINDLVSEIETVNYLKTTKDSYKHIEDKSKHLIADNNLKRYFFDKKFQLSFVGTSPYAKSYMTSEYLHQYFKKNPMFDYTPIVSGYLKSIEQLLYEIYISYKNSDNAKPKMNMFTLGSYTNYLKNNTTIFRIDLQSELETIIDCLDSYRAESRNRLFHRDNFSDWNRVEMIRENTVVLYIILLGAVDYQLLQRNAGTLGVLDDKYDRLFRILDTDDAHHYTVIVDGKEYTGLHKAPRSEGVRYNKYGIIKTPIKFTKFDYDYNVNIEISRQKMPTEIWITDAFGKREKRIW